MCSRFWYDGDGRRGRVVLKTRRGGRPEGHPLRVHERGRRRPTACSTIVATGARIIYIAARPVDQRTLYERIAQTGKCSGAGYGLLSAWLSDDIFVGSDETTSADAVAGARGLLLPQETVDMTGTVAQTFLDARAAGLDNDGVRRRGSGRRLLRRGRRRRDAERLRPADRRRRVHAGEGARYGRGRRPSDPDGRSTTRSRTWGTSRASRAPSRSMTKRTASDP